MKCFIGNTLIGLMSCAGIAALLTPSHAEAGIVVHHANWCGPVSDTQKYRLLGYDYLSNPDEVRSAFVCPLLDDPNRRHSDIVELEAYVRDRNSTAGTEGKLVVEACVQFYGFTGGACGAASSTSDTGVGNQLLTGIDVSALLSHPDDFAHVWVTLPKSLWWLSTGSENLFDTSYLGRYVAHY
jgi:hypothetical protein